MKQRTAKRARLQYTSTLASTLTSVKSLKTSETIAFTTQFVVADKEFAVPMTCKGYISALIVHGGELMPNEKNSKKKATPKAAMTPPNVYVSSGRSSPLYAMPKAVISQHKAMNGRVRKMIYRLPSLSM